MPRVQCWGGFYKLALPGGPESLIRKARPSSAGTASQVEVVENEADGEAKAVGEERIMWSA